MFATAESDIVIVTVHMRSTDLRTTVECVTGRLCKGAGVDTKVACNQRCLACITGQQRLRYPMGTTAVLVAICNNDSSDNNTVENIKRRRSFHNYSAHTFSVSCATK